MKLKQGMRLKENGSIEYRFVIDGKRYSVCAKTQKAVIQKEMELRNKVAQGYIASAKTASLSRYFEAWIKEQELTKKGGTIYLYKLNFKNHILPNIGDKKLCDIEKKDVLNMQKAILEEVSAQTANQILSLLKNILHCAVKDEILRISPAQNVEKIPAQKSKANVTIHRGLTLEEQHSFFRYVKDEWLYELFCLMLLSGIRGGEACAIEWDDIGEKYITVKRTIAVDGNGKKITNYPKSDTSYRTIPLNSAIRSVLNQQREKLKLLRRRKNEKNIFLSSIGLPIMQTSKLSDPINRTLQRMEKDGVHMEKITSHAMRDTFATRFLENGGDLKTLQTLLGHSTFQMTADLYAHVLDDRREKAMELMNIEI